MRDFLYSRVRGARDLDRPNEAVVGMLTQIAGELRAIRTLVTEQRTRA
jgi:hypothetical protein